MIIQSCLKIKFEKKIFGMFNYFIQFLCNKQYHSHFLKQKECAINKQNKSILKINTEVLKL